MNGNYKKMMAQHGGYIPFSVLGKQSNSSKGNSYKSSSSKRTSRVRKNTGRMKTGKMKTGKMKTEKKTSRLNTTKYAVGTIIRKNNQLVMLSNQRQWQPVKFT
jgi:hypothetical protein